MEKEGFEPPTFGFFDANALPTELQPQIFTQHKDAVLVPIELELEFIHANGKVSLPSSLSYLSEPPKTIVL